MPAASRGASTAYCVEPNARSRSLPGHLLSVHAPTSTLFASDAPSERIVTWYAMRESVEVTVHSGIPESRLEHTPPRLAPFGRHALHLSSGIRIFIRRSARSASSERIPPWSRGDSIGPCLPRRAAHLHRGELRQEHTFTWRAPPGETPALSGWREVTGWTQVGDPHLFSLTVSGNTLWKADGPPLAVAGRSELLARRISIDGVRGTVTETMPSALPDDRFPTYPRHRSPTTD